MGSKPRDELGLSADALRMRTSIEQRLFGPQLPRRAARRPRAELGHAYVPRRGRTRVIVVAVVLVAIAIAIAWLLA